MISGARTGLRASGLFLLGLATCLTAFTRGPARNVSSFSSYVIGHRAAPEKHTESRVKLALHAGIRHALAEFKRTELTSPSSSITRRLTRRVFLEDAPPSSSAMLEATALRLPVRSGGLVRGALDVVPRSSVAESNRQRGP